MGKLVMLYVCVLFLSFVSVVLTSASAGIPSIPGGNSGCYEIGFSFPYNERGSNDAYFFTAGDDAKITLNYNCTTKNSSTSDDWDSWRRRRGRLEAIWNIPRTNSTEKIRLFDMRHMYGDEWRIMSQNFDKEFRVTITYPIHSISGDYPSGQINITIPNIGLVSNNSEILVEDRYERKQPLARIGIFITCCKAGSIPQNFIPLGTPTANEQGCSKNLIARCKTGSLFSTGNTTSYLPYVGMECDVTNEWKHLSDVECLPIESFGFTSATVTLKAGKPVVFVCKSNQSLTTEIQIGNQSISKQKGLAWKNITFGPEDNNMVARCIVTDGNVTVHERTTQLDIQFSPMLISRDLHFKLSSAVAGYITIKFETNPPVSSRCIGCVELLKNGTNINNFYVKEDGVSHTVVVHFTKVLESDFGNYTMILMSYFALSTDLNVTFDITESMEAIDTIGSQQQQETASSNIASIVLGSALFLCIICLVIVVIKNRSNKPKVTPTPIDDVVIYNETACDNYETIDVSNPGNPQTRNTEMNGEYANVDPMSEHYMN